MTLDDDGNGKDMKHEDLPYDGWIEVISSCMYAGKTTTLCARVRRHQIAGHKCLVLKHEEDKRYHATMLSTHDKVHMEAVSVNDLSELSKEIFDGVKVVAIDEAQFKKGLVDFCEYHANRGRIVIVAGLDGSSEREPMGEMHLLISKAEKWDKLSAVCIICGKDGAFTKRLVDSKEEKLIGGPELYQARCRKCFHIPIETQDTGSRKRTCQNVVVDTNETTTESEDRPLKKLKVRRRAQTNQDSEFV